MSLAAEEGNMPVWDCEPCLVLLIILYVLYVPGGGWGHLQTRTMPDSMRWDCVVMLNDDEIPRYIRIIRPARCIR